MIRKFIIRCFLGTVIYLSYFQFKLLILFTFIALFNCYRCAFLFALNMKIIRCCKGNWSMFDVICVNSYSYKFLYSSLHLIYSCISFLILSFAYFTHCLIWWLIRKSHNHPYILRLLLLKIDVTTFFLLNLPIVNLTFSLQMLKWHHRITPKK